MWALDSLILTIVGNSSLSVAMINDHKHFTVGMSHLSIQVCDWIGYPEPLGTHNTAVYLTSSDVSELCLMTHTCVEWPHIHVTQSAFHDVRIITHFSVREQNRRSLQTDMPDGWYTVHLMWIPPISMWILWKKKYPIKLARGYILVYREACKSRLNGISPHVNLSLDYRGTFLTTRHFL